MSQVQQNEYASQPLLIPNLLLDNVSYVTLTYQDADSRKLLQNVEYLRQYN